MESKKQQAMSSPSFSNNDIRTPGGKPDRDGHSLFDFKQETDARDPSQINGLKDIPGLVKDNQLDKALAILCEHEKTYPDLEFIYAWKAHIHLKKSDADTARTLLTTGLKNAKTKHLICDRLGFLESETGNIEKAVQWWMQSIYIMHQSGKPVIWEPFLYLGHVARSIGLEKEHRALLAAANIVCRQGKEMELAPRAADRLDALSRKLENTGAAEAVIQLCRTCLGKRSSGEPDVKQNKDTPEQGQPPASSGLSVSQSASLPVSKNRKRLQIVVIVAAILSLLYYFISPLFDTKETEKISQPRKEKPLTSKTAPAPPKTVPEKAPEKTAGVIPQKKPGKNIEPDITPAPPAKTAPAAIPAPPVHPDTAEPKADTPDKPKKARPSYMKHKTKQPDAGLRKKE